MSLTMRTTKVDEQITGYLFIAPSTEREPQMCILVGALQALTPGSTDEVLRVSERQILAAVSLQLAALLEDWNARTLLARNARSVLRGVRMYLTHHRDRFVADGYNKAVADAKVTPAYAYFDYDWDKLLAEPSA